MLSARQLLLERGEQVIFDRLNVSVHAGQKVGIVGRNGSGKSTLFALLRRQLGPTEGDIDVPPGWRIACMAQEPEPSPVAALDYVIDGHRELRQVQARIARAEAAQDNHRLANLMTQLDDLGGYQAEAKAGEILYGLGFNSAEFSKPQADFSGGWRVRLSLAQTLMSPSDLLLLDEPTNHLDMDTTVWLEQWLARYPGTLLVIAHDRAFLDTVSDYILHLHQYQGDLYRGNYSAFETQRAAKLEAQQATYQKQQAKIAHVQQFVDRFRAKATKAKQVQSRIKALEKMQLVAPVHAESPYQFAFSNPQQVSSPLISLDAVDLGYGRSRVLGGVSASILPGDRIGVLGVNGAGKSTLLKCLCGELTPQQGEVVRGRHSRVGYFAQHQLETLDADQTPLGALQSRFEVSEQAGWDYLGRWGFDKSMTERRIATLSGGEKARLVLAMIARTEPALLILDEPTNHLDLDMREALALALQDYAGALLLVSHDRALIERTVDTLWLVRGGAVAEFDDSVDAYTQQTLNAPAPGSIQAAGAATGGSAGSGLTAKARRQQAAALRERQKPLRKRLRTLEADIASLTTTLKEVEAKLADPDSYQQLPPDELDELLKRSARLRSKLEGLEEAWLVASEELDGMS